MRVLETIPEVDHIIKYKITPVKSGVNLRIWETVVNVKCQETSYVFVANHHLPSAAAAQAILDHYLTVYEAVKLSNTQDKGQFKSSAHFST
ncbi:MAG: hypothetical protein F6K19_28705 [Cyanothece sp. SIO1E1]|nr:hypothetical protein [Cyanothece sp. SIO1E1]